MRKTRFLSIVALLGWALSAQAGAPPGFDPNGGLPEPTNYGCLTPSARADLDINNVRAMIHNGGDMWWELSCCPRYEIPKVDDPGAIKRHSMFAASIWVSGREQGTNNIYVMAQTYRSTNNQSFWPGPIDNLTSITSPTRCRQWDKMFKVNRQDVLDFEARFASGLVRTKDDVPQSILRWPGKGNPYLPAERGFEGIDMSFETARFIDRDGDGIYDPLAGDSPRLPGREGQSSGADQVLFWVMNDVGGRKVFSGTSLNNRPIGMEIQSEAFGYATADYVNDMTFYRNKLVNKGTTILDDCYFGHWSDPDLGFASDDYVAFNVPRGLAICYNGDDFDDGVNGYGANPPTVAVDFFKGPVADPGDGIDNNKNCVVDEPGELIIASNFVYYNNTSSSINGNPTVAQDYFNFQRSIWRNSAVMTYDLRDGTQAIGTNVPGIGPAPKSNFIFPGESDISPGWSIGGTCQNPQRTLLWDEVSAGNPPGDRRMLTNAGPFTLRPGAVNELTVGVVWARASTGGALGSLNKLLAADDAAQKLFDNDFKILDGPDAPDVEITELDRELLFTVIPHERRDATGNLVNTETYQERDFNSRLRDPFYRFEGYLVYQLFDASVGFGDLDNPDKARLLANVSSDVRNGVGTIINEEFDETVGAFQQRVKVRGADRGLTRTFSIKEDAFSPGGGKLVNFNRYYFTVLAYGYNGDSSQQIKYILGRQNRNKFTAIPHKVDPSNGGTVLNASFNQSLDVTRLQGVGNGGTNFDSLNTQDEADILRDGAKQAIRYTNGKSPVQVRIYNPKNVKSADLQIRLYSRVSYRGDFNKFSIGDRIISAPWPTLTDPALVRDLTAPQDEGVGIVVGKRRRVGADPNLVDLVVEVLNNRRGGRFTQLVNRIDPSRNQFSEYDFLPRPFFKESNPGDLVTCDEYQPYDFWRLYDSTGNAVDSAGRPVSFLNEQLSTKYGLLVSIRNVIDPGTRIFVNPANGLQEGSIVSANATRRWVVPIEAPPFDEESPANWWRRDAASIFYANGLDRPNRVEVAGALRRILSGSFAPTPYVDAYTAGNDQSGGAPVKFVDSTIYGMMQRLQNVDIVMTPDTSKWTRVFVIRGEELDANGQPIRVGLFRKSRIPSVGKTFAPTGASSTFQRDSVIPSRGMSWFPGYAIDLDRGVRLNMAFLESRISDPTGGADLQWRPTGGPFGGKNYVYVMSTQYDQGRNAERLLDSVQARIPGETTFKNNLLTRLVWRNMMWIGRVAVPQAAPFLGTQTRVRLRIDKAYRAYPDSGGPNGTPTYGFSTKGLEASTNVTAVAQRALDLIRVVPNPYYAYSTYEQSQIDNRVRLTNLPTRCQISIFNLSGSLVRRFTVDRSTEAGIEAETQRNLDINSTTFLDWDLKTQTGLPIASGVYIIHINAYNLGEKTVKWFGIMRPTDLDAVSN